MSTKQTALITGASSGIGLEFAKIFAREGYNLVLVARREDRLVELKNTLEKQYQCKVLNLVCDLTELNAANQVYDQLKTRGVPIDVLVNNAGFGLGKRFVKADMARMTEMIQLNVIALMQLTRLILPQMVERKSGKVLNVASMAGFAPGPLSSVYYATKAFVVSFTEAIACELRENNVIVSALCPGPVKSEFQKVAYKEDPSKTKRQNIPTAQETAEYGYRALMRGKVLAVPGFMNKVLLFAARHMPRFAVIAFAYYKQSSLNSPEDQ